MALTLTSEERRGYEANVRKFFFFRFFVEFQLWLPIWVLYLTEERGLSLTTVTLMDVPFWLLMVFAEVPTGAVADRWGRKTSMSIGTFLYSLAILTFGLGATLPVLIASYLIWAISWTLWSGADSAFLYDSLKALGREHEFQKLFGRSWAFQSAGAMLGLLAGAPLAEATSLWMPVVLSAGLAFAGFLVTLSFREPPRLEQGEHQQTYLEGLRTAFHLASRRSHVRYAILLWSVISASMIAGVILQQPFLDSHDVRVGLFGWLLLPGQMLAIAAALLAYRLAAVVGQVRLMAALPLLAIGGMACISAFDSVYAFAAFPLFSLSRALAFPLFSDFVNRRVGSAHRATILSFQALLFSLWVAPVEPAMGWMADNWSIPRAFSIAVIVVAVVTGSLVALWLNSLRKEEAADEAPALMQAGGG